MSFNTEHFGLVALQRGDVISVVAQKNNMSIIDSHLAYLLNIQDNFILNGWEIQFENSDIIIGNRIVISQGSGFIDKNFVRSFGSLQYVINQVGDYYIYLQKKYQYTALFSKTSNIFQIECSGLSSPESVTGFVTNGIQKNSINLLWDKNSEPDIYLYQISRGTDGILYQNIFQVMQNLYSDYNLQQDTEYYYRIRAKNKSGQYSSYSYLTASTSLDLSQPQQVIDLLISSGDSQIFVTWKSLDSNIGGYVVQLFSMSSDRLTQTLVSSSSIQQNNIIFSSLTNNVLYKVYVYAVSYNAVQSEGISALVSIYQTKLPPIIQNLTISQSQNLSELSSIDLKINFDQNVIIGRSQAVKFAISVQQNNNFWSDEIFITKNSSLSNQFTLSSYIQSGLKKVFTARRQYLIKISPVNSQNKYGVSRYYYLETQNFVSPNSVSSIKFSQNQNDMIITWENSRSSFISNIFSLKIINTLDNSFIEIQNQLDLKMANSYILKNFKQYFSKKIQASIFCIDDYSLSSTVYYGNITLPDIDTNLVPSGVVRTSISTGYGDVYLAWQSVSQIDKYYYIWRIVDNGNLSSIQISDYELIDKIQYPMMQYIDYSAQLGVKYFYFITTQDIYGRKQLGPQDNVNSYSHLRGFVRGSPMVPPSVTGVQQNIYDAVIYWSYQNDNFDGFQIYRSQENKISWVKVGSTDKNSSSFIDVNGITKNTKYYYFVRKFRNQVRFNVVRNQLDIPQSSIYLLKANYDGFNIQYQTKFNRLNNLSDFIQSTVKQRVVKHNHKNDSNYDKRIDLDENVIVRNFTSSDNFIFTTQEEINVADKYVVLVDNKKYNGNYSLNISQKSILFSQSVSGIVQLQCIGLNQIIDIVRYGSINKCIADVISSGKIYNRQIQFRHNIKQKIQPAKFLGQTENGFQYFYTRQSKIGEIGKSITFYDFIRKGSNIYSSTSNGIMFSQDDGNTWQSIMRTQSPCHSIFSNSNSNLFALCSQNVYISQTGQIWTKCIGTQDTNAIRDICQDNIGNIYISSDIGVFILQPGFSFLNPKIQLTNPYDLNISDSFGIYFDNDLSCVVVSTSKGFLKTLDYGESWEIFSQFNYLDIVYQFEKNDSSIFALSDSKVYRRKISNFQQIANLNEYSRRIYYFQNSLYVLSDGKVFKTNDSINIDNDVSFKIDVPILISCNTKNVDVTAFNVFSGQILIAGDCVFNRFDQYGVQLNNIYQDYSKIIPSFYINDRRIKTSVYYNIDKNSVWFDTIVYIQNKVGIVVNYEIYCMKNGGWVDLGYTANVSVFKNNNNIFQFAGISSNSILNTLKNVDFSSISQNNSNIQLSNKYINKYNQNNVKLQNIFAGVYTLDNNQTRQSVVFDSFTYFRKSFSRNINEIKFFSIKNILQRQYTIVSGFALVEDNFNQFGIVDLIPYMDQVEIPQSQYAFVYSSSGIVQMQQPCNKYDVITIEINFGSNSQNISHEKLQDGIQLVNSGLEFGISDILSKNIVSMSNFIQRQWLGQIDGTVDIYGYKPFSKYNMVNIIPQNDDQFNKIDSSAFYINKINYTSFGFTFQYISYANFLPWLDVFLVSGTQGLVSIDRQTINFTPVYNDLNRDFKNIKDIYILDQVVYVISQNNIYMSSDLIEWQIYNSFGCYGNYIKFFSNNGIEYIITDNGIYYKMKNQMLFTFAKQITRYDSYACNSYITVIDNGVVFYSIDGIQWKTTSQISFDVNDSISYRNQIAVATSKGLKFDFGSIVNGSPQFGSIIIQGTSQLSQAVIVNSLNTSEDKQFLLAGSNSGNIYKIQGQNLISKIQTNMNMIKFVFIIDDKIWAISNNSIYMQDIGDPIKISTGIPF